VTRMLEMIKGAYKLRGKLETLFWYGGVDETFRQTERVTAPVASNLTRDAKSRTDFVRDC
jgi:hypothetical protein